MPSYRHAVPWPFGLYVRSCEGYDYRFSSEATHHGLPSTGLTLIIAFDEPLDCGWLDGRGRDRFITLVAGLHTRPVLIHTHGYQHGIQITLTPLGSRVLFGAPASAFAHAMVDGDDQHRLPGSLQRRLQPASWPQRFSLLDAFLGRRIDEGRPQMRPEVRRAWDLCRAQRGQVRVEAIARDVGLSRRQLLTMFRNEFGVSPKEVCRVARFEHAEALLGSGRELAQIAADAGYADQPHLHREWQQMAGMTPLESLDDFPIVHDNLT